jgi:hypothetical protein
MNKPFNIFDKPVPTAKSTMLGDLELTAEEFDALKKQIAHGLGQVQHVADAHDELANAVGELGSATNPIGFSSIPASLAYMKRLRTIDAGRIQLTRKRSALNKTVSRFPIDEYFYLGIDGVSHSLFFSGYQPKDATIAPEGFTLAK